MHDGFILAVAIILGCVASSAFAQVKTIQGQDVSVKAEVPTPKTRSPASGWRNWWPSDHWRRLTTARSTDDGLTWTDHQVHFDYGRVHAKLTALANGDILITYASRMGNVDGQMYHGIEAVLSRDHGKT